MTATCYYLLRISVHLTSDQKGEQILISNYPITVFATVIEKMGLSVYHWPGHGGAVGGGGQVWDAQATVCLSKRYIL